MKLRIFALVFGLLGANLASAITVLSTDFNSSMPSEFSGAGGLEGIQGYAGVGAFSGNFLRNGAIGTSSSFTFTGLGSHTSITIDFLLAAIDSWDSDNGSVAPDYFGVRVDGTEVFTATFANASGSNTYSGNDIGSGLVQRGFNGSWAERAYDMSTEAALQNISHTSSTLVVDFIGYGAGYQGGDDESWAIDNLTITAEPVPEPATMLALAAGLGLIANRRKKA